MSDVLPTLFVSHGAPDLLLSPQHEAVAALRQLGNRKPEPHAIVMVSAHWIHDPVGITTGEHLATIHDFGGFPDELYALHYPATGDDDLSSDIAQRLKSHGIANELKGQRGLDHGAWMPLYCMYPEAHIPVVQVSLPAGSWQELVQLGKALGPLRKEGMLVIGSGGSVHNLRALNREHRTEDWAREFEAWLREAVEENHFEWLITTEHFPPDFQRAHPTLEHYAPLIVAWAGGGMSGTEPDATTTATAPVEVTELRAVITR